MTNRPSFVESYFPKRLSEITPQREGNHERLAELATLYVRSFERPYLTRSERERMDYLASHLRQRITLNPGPPASETGLDEPYVRWEGKAREILASIALNPDAHHWSYTASVIQEAVDEALAEAKA